MSECGLGRPKVTLTQRSQGYLYQFIYRVLVQVSSQALELIVLLFEVLGRVITQVDVDCKHALGLAGPKRDWSAHFPAWEYPGRHISRMW